MKNRMQMFEEDAVIIREGEIKDEMYKIISGKVAVYLNYGKENEYLLGVFSEQQCFGENCILCHEPSLYTVIALYEVLLMKIREDEFDDFVKNNYSNAIDMIRSLTKSLVNLRCNINMLLEEMSQEKPMPPCKVQELRRKIYETISYQPTNEIHFHKKI